MKERILSYLKGETLDFTTGVRLYQSHPGHKKPILHNIKSRPNWEVMRTRLIYELELLVGLPPSNRVSVIEEASTSNQFPIADIPDYEYKIPIEQLSEKQRKLITRKAQLYNYRDKLQKELSSIGTANDQKSITARAECMDKLVEYTLEIKSIHAVLSHFIPNEDGSFPEVPTPNAIEIAISDELESEYHYIDMPHESRLELLRTLQATLPGVKDRAENAEKKKSQQLNAARARRMEQMIMILRDYADQSEQAQATE